MAVSQGSVQERGPVSPNATDMRIHLPAGVQGGAYSASVPLIRPSRLTTRQNGGVGKQLSDGWCVNFAVGCSHGCNFCYVDGIYKRFGRRRYGEAVLERWGNYMLVPSNLQDAIEKTPWRRWKGKEAMMSSTHDPYLPTIASWTRKILEAALPQGVKFCIQTRSLLVLRDLEFLAKYREQIRLQVSIATMSGDLGRLIEPRVPPPRARVDVLRAAKEAGIDVGVILAPIFPPVQARPNAEEDLAEMVDAIAKIPPEHIYGESLHVRGENLRLIQVDLRDNMFRVTPEFDKGMAKTFHAELKRVGLRGVWWYEH
ncbi:MAG: radical SAM protein [Methanobacteriota archaeon]|nr:MAG: radical SAM protein [Euryarchaeota archaeon]